MKPHEITHNFLKRFKELGEYLKTADVELTHFETFDPVEEEVIEMMEEELNIKLDETFLAYFRESDGYELKYTIESEGVKGAIMIPALESILFLGRMELFGQPGQYNVEILGGRDDYETRSNLYCFDRFDEDGDGMLYYGVYYLVTENVLIHTNDYNAALSDSHPITVPSYMELCLATAGLTNRRQMLTHGAAGNYDIVDFTIKDYEGLYPWNNSISLAKKGLVSKPFYDLTHKVTKGERYDLRFMKFPEDDLGRV